MLGTGMTRPCGVSTVKEGTAKWQGGVSLSCTVGRMARKKAKTQEQAVSLLKTRDGPLMDRRRDGHTAKSESESREMQEQSRQLVEDKGQRSGRSCVALLDRGQGGQAAENENEGTKPSTH